MAKITYKRYRGSKYKKRLAIAASVVASCAAGIFIGKHYCKGPTVLLSIDAEKLFNHCAEYVENKNSTK